MICSYLLHAHRFDSDEQALNHYGKERTIDLKVGTFVLLVVVIFMLCNVRNYEMQTMRLYFV